MNSVPSSRRTRAFTLVEMLTVIAIIGILAALLLPVLSEGKARAKRVWCESNLEQVGLAFHLFANDHTGKFPMQVPVSNGGSQEFVQNGYLVNGEFYFAFRQFQVMSGALGTPKILICPADTRRPASNFGALQNSNLSYFVGVNADPVVSHSILAGDRNITNSLSLNPTIIEGAARSLVRWTRELHEYKGNMLFADTHVEEWNSVTISWGANSPLAAANLFLPSVMPGENPLPANAPGFNPGRSPTTSPDSASTDNAGSQPGPQPAAPMASPPGPAEGNSVNRSAEPGTFPAIQAQPQNSSGVTNITSPAAPVPNVVAVAPSNEPVSVMSPFDRQVVKFLRTYTEWGYLALLLLLLLLLLLFEARRRWRQRKKD